MNWIFSSHERRGVIQQQLVHTRQFGVRSENQEYIHAREMQIKNEQEIQRMENRISGTCLILPGMPSRPMSGACCRSSWMRMRRIMTCSRAS